MMDLRTRPIPTLLRLALLALGAFALGACAPLGTRPSGPSGVPTVRPGEPGRYQAVHDAATVAELRAAPPPAQAELSDSQSPSGDERVLGAKGFARIGDGWYRGDAERARRWFAETAHTVGADRVLLYAPEADAAEAHAAFYVQFKLPFGARFRDLHPDERDAVGGGGVSIVNVIGNSPASQANLIGGDIVVAFDGQPVRDRKHFEALLHQHMGKRVTLTLWRNGATQTRPLRLGILPGAAADK